MPRSNISEQYGPVKPSVAPPSSRDLEEFVRMVIRTMKRRGELHGPEEDAFQWAALAVWEGVVLRGTPLVAGNRVWHFKAARLKVLYQQRRAQCAASVYDRYARRAPIGWAGVAGEPHAEDEHVVDVAGGVSPEARRALADERATRSEVARAIRWHLAQAPQRDREAIGIVLADRPAGDAAWLTGTTVLEVNGAIERLGKRVRADRGAVRSRRKLADLAA